MAGHEGEDNFNNITSERNFTDADKADDTVDLLNNKIGLDYQIANPTLKERDLALGIIKIYNTTGLYEINVEYDNRNNPTYRVIKKTISDKKYNQLKNSYSKHDDYGRWLK